MPYILDLKMTDIYCSALPLIINSAIFSSSQLKKVLEKGQNPNCCFFFLHKIARSHIHMHKWQQHRTAGHSFHVETAHSALEKMENCHTYLRTVQKNDDSRHFYGNSNAVWKRGRHLLCSAASFKEVSRYVFLTFRSWGLLKYDFSAFFPSTFS